MSVLYFVVNDDVVLAHCLTDVVAATFSCALVIPHQYYKLTVKVEEGVGFRSIAGCSSCVNSEDRAIAAVKEYLSTKLAPKEHWAGDSGLQGKTFWYPQDSRPYKVFRRIGGEISGAEELIECLIYKVFRRVGGGISGAGHGDLLECIEVQEGEFEPWQYFIARKVTLYESQLNELIQE